MGFDTYLVKTGGVAADLACLTKVMLVARRCLSTGPAVVRPGGLAWLQLVLAMIFLGADDATSPAVVALAVPRKGFALVLVGNATTAAPVGLHLLVDCKRVSLSDLI